jgi:SAM-dependent methyltransferase
MFILRRYTKFYIDNGFSKTIVRIFSAPIRRINKIFLKKKYYPHLSLKSSKERFDFIYKTNFWGSTESLSGGGSEIRNTGNIRKQIKDIINKYNIKKILDAPCGDFNWIKLIIDDRLEYIGADIVENLILKNINDYKSKNINFVTLDITKDKLPDADLMLCRDCLIHLSNLSIKKFIQNFKNSKIKYLLLTSYETKKDDLGFKNKDIQDGDFRSINLLKPPFRLPNPLLKILDRDHKDKNHSSLCYLYMYSKDQLINLYLY